MDAKRARELLDRERQRIEGADTDESESVDEVSLADQYREELEAVERAEQRLEEGTYGLSIESGEPIPDARLELIPWAERTAEEQERWERGG
jgi:RNA polymerase-binding transcription factor